MMHKKLTIWVMAALTLAVLSSCLKTVTNNNKTNPAGLTFFNMVPYGPSFSVQVDGVKVGDSSTYRYANAWDSLPPTYLSEFAGIHTISFLDDTGADLVTGSNIQFAANTNYSVWLFDTLNSFGLNAVQLSDSWDSIPYGYCLVRFLNFSPNFTPVDFGYRNIRDSFDYTYPYNTVSQAYMGNTTLSAATLSSYTQFAPGYYTFVFHYSYDTTFTQIDSLSDTLAAAHAYTIFIAGLWDSSGLKAFRKGTIHMN